MNGCKGGVNAEFCPVGDAPVGYLIHWDGQKCSRESTKLERRVGRSERSHLFGHQANCAEVRATVHHPHYVEPGSQPIALNDHLTRAIAVHRSQ